MIKAIPRSVKPSFSWPRLGLILLMALALLHGLIYLRVVPIWEAPDEPLVYEYAALIAELGHVPDDRDRSPALEARLLDLLNRHSFWIYRTGSHSRRPRRLPRPLAEHADRARCRTSGGRAGAAPRRRSPSAAAKFRT